MKTKTILSSVIMLTFISCTHSKENDLRNELATLEQQQKELRILHGKMNDTLNNDLDHSADLNYKIPSDMKELNKRVDSELAYGKKIFADTAFQKRLVHVEAQLDKVNDRIKEVKDSILLKLY